MTSEDSAAGTFWIAVGRYAGAFLLGTICLVTLGALWLFIFFTGPWEGIAFSFGFLFAGIAAYAVWTKKGSGAFLRNS